MNFANDHYIQKLYALKNKLLSSDIFNNYSILKPMETPQYLKNDFISNEIKTYIETHKFKNISFQWKNLTCSINYNGTINRRIHIYADRTFYILLKSLQEMEILRTIGRILLGALLVVSGLLLSLRMNPSGTLPGFLERLGPLKLIAPHFMIYFKINAALFSLAGLLLILNKKIGMLIQFLGSLMFIMTYDNPFLYQRFSEQAQRVFFILCHLMIIAAMSEMGDSKIEGGFAKPVRKTEEPKTKEEVKSS